MTRKLQILRGTTAQNNAYTGAVGELTMDTDTNEVRIHDGQTVGGIKIGKRNMPILTPKWFDHQVNDESWLNADTFSWQPEARFARAYEHLVVDCENAQTATYYAWTGEGYIAGTQETVYTTSQTPAVGDTVYLYADGNIYLSVTGTITSSSAGAITFKYSFDDVTSASFSYSDVVQLPVHLETVAGVTLSYVLAQDGHKITTEEAAVMAIYEATGTAWYYLLDRTNKQFKLPRTKWGFTGLRDSVGGYIAPGLPNIAGKTKSAYGINNSTANSGALKTTIYTGGTSSGIQDGGSGSDGEKIQSSTIEINASNSNPIYGASDTVQPPATQMYLYFYVGDFEQSATEQTAGLNAELFNNKADTDLGNIPANYDYVVETQLPTSANGYTWYRKYKSGWVEQGGIDSTGAGTKTITLPIVMKDNNYIILTATESGTSTHNATVYGRTTTSFTASKSNTVCFWQVSGVSE